MEPIPPPDPALDPAPPAPAFDPVLSQPVGSTDSPPPEAPPPAPEQAPDPVTAPTATPIAAAVEAWWTDHFFGLPLDTLTYNRLFGAKEALKPMLAATAPGTFDALVDLAFNDAARWLFLDNDALSAMLIASREDLKARLDALPQ